MRTIWRFNLVINAIGFCVWLFVLGRRVGEVSPVLEPALWLILHGFFVAMAVSMLLLPPEEPAHDR